MTFDPRLLRSHVSLYPRIIVSKSHGNTSMYMDTVINFAKNTTYCIPHTTYRMSDHSLFLNTVQATQQMGMLIINNILVPLKLY